MATNPSPSRIFISYAREDHAAALRLYRELTVVGIPCWLDTECLRPGEPWKLAVGDAIKKSRFFLALLSSNSVSKRGYIQKELSEALELQALCPPGDIFLIPIRLNDCTPKHQEIMDLNFVDLFPTWDDGIERLRRFLDDGSVAGSELFRRLADHLALKDLEYLKTVALQLRQRHDIELFLRNQLSALPKDVHGERWVHNVERYIKDLSACLELHYVHGCGKPDPKTKCHECGQHGTIVYGVMDIGGYSLSDYNDNYISWCNNCLWAWHLFWIDYHGKGPGTFNYVTNIFENMN